MKPKPLTQPAQTDGSRPPVAKKLRVSKMATAVSYSRARPKPPSHKRIELGRFIVSDSDICHGKPTFKGSRVMVWQVLDGLQRGESVDDLSRAWAHAVTPESIAEAVKLAAVLFRDARSLAAIRRAARVAGGA